MSDQIVQRDAFLVSLKNCLDAARLVAGLREIVREYLEPYEECIDGALSAHLELLSGLFCEYNRRHGTPDAPFLDCGEEPMSLDDAKRLIDRFMELASNNINAALTDPAFVLPAPSIEVRAQTFSGMLKET